MGTALRVLSYSWGVWVGCGASPNQGGGGRDGDEHVPCHLLRPWRGTPAQSNRWGRRKGVSLGVTPARLSPTLRTTPCPQGGALLGGSGSPGPFPSLPFRSGWVTAHSPPSQEGETPHLETNHLPGGGEGCRPPGSEAVLLWAGVRVPLPCSPPALPRFLFCLSDARSRALDMVFS